MCGLCVHVPKARGDRAGLSHKEASFSKDPKGRLQKKNGITWE